MDLTQLVAKPQLVKLILDDEETINSYNEPIEFYTYDRQPLDTFLKLSNSLGVDQTASIETLKTLVLDKDGNPVMNDDTTLPIRIMIRVMAKVMDLLGK